MKVVSSFHFVCALPLHRNKIDFCVLILYPAALLNLFTRFNRFLDSLGLSVHQIMYVQTEIVFLLPSQSGCLFLISFFPPYFFSFLSFSLSFFFFFLIARLYLPVVLNRNGESTHPFLVLDCGGQHPAFYSLCEL